MPKLDISCGLKKSEIDMIKFAIGNMHLRLKLPLMPEHIEMKLFFEGRDAWTYSWQLLGQDAEHRLYPMLVEVEAKLKKEFHQYQSRKIYTFICQLELKPERKSPVRAIYEKTSENSSSGKL